MKLQSIEFGNVLGASGVQGFFGEGYWFHRVLGPFGPNFSNMTFVSKTATLNSCKGNMLLKQNHSPRDWFPSCIKAQPLGGIMLNSVGLSNPGLRTLLETSKWFKSTEPFFISIMSVADTQQERLQEFSHIIERLLHEKSNFSTTFGLQINLSCPNTNNNPRELTRESTQVLEIASALGVPLMLKYSIASAPIEAILKLNDNPLCDAICVSNTIPYNWNGVGESVWGKKVSPLAHLGGGGVSGKILSPLVCAWIQELRQAGFTKPINGGGGILCHEDITHYHNAGASSIFLGSVAVLRPWRVGKIIAIANKLDWR